MKIPSSRPVYISGGSSGIGLAVAELFVSKGHDILIFSVDPQEQIDQAVSKISAKAKGTDQNVHGFRLDVTDVAAVEKILREKVDQFGAPGVVVNSAGIGGAVYFEQLPYERFDATMKINLYGTRNVIAALIPSMKEKGGAIVNVASFSGLVGIVGYTAYSSSKFAVVGFSQSLRSEMKQHNIWVSVVCPPQVDTPLLKKTDPDKPPETKSINDKAGVLSAEEVAKDIFEGIEAGKFLIISGRKAKLFHLFNRLLPTLREKVTDKAIEKIRRTKKGA